MKKLVAVGLTVVVGATFAANVEWQNAEGGDYKEVSNWKPQREPSSGDYAVFGLAGDYTVTASSEPIPSGGLQVNGDAHVTFDLRGAGWDFANKIINVPLADSTGLRPMLTIASGSITNVNRLSIGSYASLGPVFTVTGTGTRFATGGDDFYIGTGNSNATFVAEKGAEVTSGRHFRICTGASSKDALAYFDGATLTVANNLTVGEQGGGARLVATGGTKILSCVASGSQITVGSSANACGNTLALSNRTELSAAARSCTLGNASSSKDNRLVLAGGSTMTVGSLTVGNGSDGNAIEVSGGSTLSTSGHFAIGSGSGARGNSGLIAGAGTRLDNANFDITVGRNGADNELVISDGAQVTTTRDIYAGSHHDVKTPGTNNLIRVEGEGTLLFPRENIYAGKAGVGNRIVIADGAVVSNAVSNTGLHIGFCPNTCSNRVEVLNGARLEIVGECKIGDGNNVNSLTDAVWDNELLVSNATFHAHNYLRINPAGTNNNLRVLDGAKVIVNQNILFGGSQRTLKTGGSDSLISGEGTVVTNTQYDLVVGQYAPDTKLTVADGAEVFIQRNVYIGPCDNNYLYAGSNSCLHVRNAAVHGAVSPQQGGTMYVRFGGQLVVEGAQTKVDNGAKGLDATNSGVLEFLSDRNGFGLVELGEKFVVDSSTKLVIDATELQRRGGGGDFTLMTYPSCSAALQTIPVEVVGRGVTYTAGATSLTCHVPRIGLLILLK